MLLNFLKTALRSLLRYKLHSTINIIGLAIGMMASLLILSYVYFETSYDKHHKNYKNIYRIYSHISLPNGSTVEGPVSNGSIAPLLQEQIPGIKKTTRLMGYRHREIESNHELFSNSKVMWADSGYFDIFTHKFIAGNPKDALVEPFTVVLTQSFAKRLFGDKEALNQIIKFENENYRISAIIKDAPINSHLKFEVLGSFSSVSNEKRDVVQQSAFNFFTYVLCDENVDFNEITRKADELTAIAVERIIKGMGITTKSKLQALKDIHLKSKSFYELEAGGDINNVYIFGILSVFILIIAIVNFINLVTANSETRAKEIGLRKVMGAFRGQLFLQFIGEAILITLIALILAVSFAELFISSFRELMDSPIILPYWKNPLLLVYIFAGVVIIGFISGSYPAIYLSRFSPAKVLKGSKSSSSKNALLRKFLVVFQFSIAIFLLINLALLYTQVDYMKNKDLGFDKDQVMVIEKFSDKIRTSFEALKAELMMNPNIVSIGAAEGVPGNESRVDAMHNHGEDVSNAIVMIVNRVQENYFNTFNIEIIEGRKFSKNIKSDKNAVILNQTAVEELGLTNPVNKKVVLVFDTLKIIGICKDYHFKSLHNKIEPISHTFSSNYFNHIAIKLNTKDLQSTINRIEETFKKTDPNLVFTYSFMDQRLNGMYQKEERINRLISYTAILAIFISVLGLFALTSFTIRQKVQEIGIRKVLGASNGLLVRMFVYNLTKWVFFAALIAIPISYYSMKRWLDGFVYHTEIKLWMYTIGSLVALLIAIITVISITNKAAKANPVNSLKYE